MGLFSSTTLATSVAGGAGILRGRFQFLGTGGSVGVPMLGCGCSVCCSQEEKNKRWRPSARLLFGDKNYLIDPGPDFRQQALRFGIKTLDGVLITHAHHDHVGGLDDLRPIGYRRTSPIPMYCSESTASDLLSRFYYLFPREGGYVELSIFRGEQGSVQLGSETIEYITYLQGEMAVNGFRIGSLAYLPDIRQFSPSVFASLRNVKDLVVGALRYTSSQMHFCVDEALDFWKQAGSDRLWLTHLSHEIDYAHTSSYLPENAHVAYDGLILDII